MPNRPALGLFGRVSDSTGAPTEPVTGMVATLPGVSSATAVLEVWAAGANQVAQLVWSSTARAPASATATFVTAAGATQYQVQIDWVLAVPRAADSYEIRRADGSLAGTVTGEATTQFFDTAPRGLNGSYTVTAVLAGISSGATATASIDLRPVTPNTPTVSYTAASHSVTVGWTQDASRIASAFTVKRADGSVAGTVNRPAVAGALSFVDAAPLPLNGAYTIVATVGAVTATPLATASIDLRPDPVTGATIVYTPGQMNVSWTPNASRKADRFYIYRVGGGLAGIASGRDTTSFVDTDPLPQTGTYTVTANEAGTTDAAGSASNSLPLGDPIGAPTIGPNNHGGRTVSWNNPAWGTPDAFLLTKSGTYLALTGTTPSDRVWTADVRFGDYTFTIWPHLSGVDGGYYTVTVSP